MKVKREVLISGGGIAGLTLALKLVKCDIPVTVIEQQDKPSKMYKGELLQPKSLSIFDLLGLLEQIKEDGMSFYKVNVKELRKHEGHWRTIGTSSLNYQILSSNYNYALMIPHERLKEMIFDELKTYETFEYISPGRFQGFDGTKAKVRIGNEVQQIDARFYVGAEGRQSPMRNAMNVSMHHTKYNHHFLTVTFPRPEHLQEGEMITTKDRFLGMFPLKNNEVRTVYLIRPQEFKGRDKREMLQEFYERYIDLMPELDGYVQQIRQWRDIQRMIPFAYHVDRYVRRNCVLIGDAAHTVHPMAGEGMNLAIQDADVLGELFCWMYENNKLDEHYLQWFEDVRKPRAEYVSKLSHQSALMYSFPSRVFQRVRLRGIKKTEEDKKLHLKQMLNISGLGLWPNHLHDRFIQVGLLPARELEVSERPYIFSTDDDYPWLKLEGDELDD
ncbi:NAD(P)/FAD-dependent oxidoreductase [Bacillus tianshenii]|nr:NAD(P)/FAD-dependent oxidoreductase [Bacillus tianshenii]